MNRFQNNAAHAFPLNNPNQHIPKSVETLIAQPQPAPAC